MIDHDEGFLGWRKETGKRARATRREEAFGWDANPAAFKMPRPGAERGPVSKEPIFADQIAYWAEDILR
jgi:hypothetical protein